MSPPSQLHVLLKQHFGYSDFRPGQLEVIRGVLARRPVLAVMPTGSGKSLCYQLPALLLDGLTLVVSPLVALMKDQVDQLRRLGIAAACLNSSQSENSRDLIEKELRAGQVKLLFVAPERLQNQHFRRLLAQLRPVLLAIDEAHCISEWGHAFRPDYERLGSVVEELQPPHIIALTATATSDVRTDIVRALRLKQPLIAVSGFDRPNIHLEVLRLSSESEKRDTLMAAVKQHRPAIIYSATRRQAANIATHLARQGMRASAYHAGQEPRLRDQVQDRFLSGQLDIVAATNAFGLGINKADVRLVLHTEVPKSLEAYYQEIGRAGRDGKPAIGALLFAPKDLFVVRRLIALSNPPVLAVKRLYERAAKATRPVPLSLLARELPCNPLGTQISAAMSFLESLDLVERRFSNAPLVIQFARGVSVKGESAVSRLAQLARGTRGVVEPLEAQQALGLNTPDELYQVLDQLESEGLISLPQRGPQAAYMGKPGGELLPEHLRRLSVRASRDNMRLKQMISLAYEETCRRAALLRTLGEASVPSRCFACDVCVGHRLGATRSKLAELRAETGILEMSHPLGTVQPSVRDTRKSP